MHCGPDQILSRKTVLIPNFIMETDSNKFGYLFREKIFEFFATFKIFVNTWHIYGCDILKKVNAKMQIKILFIF